MAQDLELQTLRLLVWIEQTGSIGAAAREVGVSQPAVSTRIREFEARWRLRVLVRTPRGSALTDEGRAVVAWAHRVLHEVDLMRAGIGALAEVAQANVSIAASLTVAEFVLPRWLGELRLLHPEVHPRLRVVNSDTVVQLVREGQASLGFIETAMTPVDLGRASVGMDRLAIVVTPDHPWARRSTPLTVDLLRDAEFVLREPGSGTRSTFEAALTAEPKVALEADSTRALVGAVHAGLGPAVVSRRAVAHEVEIGRLVEPAHELDLRRPLTAIWHRDYPPRDVVDRLLRIAQTRRSSNRSDSRRDS